MATIRLVPSVSAVSSASYAKIRNASNMYTNTDSTTYGTFTHNKESDNTYYGYLRGFNFNDVPSRAVVSSFTVKIKASATGHTTFTSSEYYMSLVVNKTKIESTSASGRLSTAVTTFTFANGSLTWDTIKGYGYDFGIRIPMKRVLPDTADVVSVYGAEIEVTYTVPNPRTVTTTLTGNGTIGPSGTQTMYDGDEYELFVKPTNPSDTVTATKNGTAITLTQHAGCSQTKSNVLGTYSLVSGSFSGSGASYFQALVGKGHDNHQTTSNYYSGESGTIAIFTYDVSFENIPDDATITNLYMLVNGHAESTSNSDEYMCARLISGSTNLSDELNFRTIGTSNSTQTVTANVTPTIAQLENLKVQCRLGYYGGAINGATVYLEYEVAGVCYTYSTTIDGDMTIAVTIGPKIFIKINGSWTQYSKIYKKVNGSWVEQSLSNWSSIFDTNTNYRKMT